MNALLIYPTFPKTFWSFERVIRLEGRKTMLPPLGLVTVAALLPQAWSFKLVDCNVRPVTEEEWGWADLVLLSGMIVQKPALLALVAEAKERGKPVAVGGPYASACPEELSVAGADYLVLDEGEVTIPPFVAALARGEPGGLFRAGGERADITTSPIPRFDLLELGAYYSLAVQFSRGCPYACEFCDIIVMHGRRPRTKTPAQLLTELDALYTLGWRRPVFLVDDNFIGNKRRVKALLARLEPWQRARHYPFIFTTEASINLAEEEALMRMMVDSHFKNVFIGFETPDAASLALTGKVQNMRAPMVESAHRITRAGLRIMAGFIIGFDGEAPGAGQRIVEFMRASSIPIGMFSTLQALPHTALWQRLEREGRLTAGDATVNQTSLPNFIPTRPMEAIAEEYVEAFWAIYDPIAYLDRTYHHYAMMGPPRHQARTDRKGWKVYRALALLLLRQGVIGPTRWRFWGYLWRIKRNNPAVLIGYLKACAYYEHFAEYREVVRREIQAQLAVRSDAA